MKKLVIVLMAVGLLASCSDDEKAPDYVKLSSGDYTYAVDLTLIVDKNYTDTDTGLLEVVYDDGAIELIFDKGTNDEVSLEVRNITPATNGYAFDLVPKGFTDGDGDTFTVRGYDTQSYDGEQYHGRFDSGNNQIYIGFYTDYDANDLDVYNTEFEFVASKK